MKKILAITVFVLFAGTGFTETVQLGSETETAAEQPTWEWWKAKRALFHAQGEMAGEVTQNSVILQSRLTWGHVLIDDQPGWPDGDVPGCPGVACFQISTSEYFVDSFKTEWIEAVPEYDFIVKTKVEGLKPGTRYYTDFSTALVESI